MDSQLAQYLPILLLALVAALMAVGMMVVSVALGARGRRNRVKDTAYECGMLPEGEDSTRFPIGFHRVAMLFILFDVEVVFLYPWAVVYREQLTDNAHWIFGSMMVFLALFAAGFVYEVRKKAFRW